MGLLPMVTVLGSGTEPGALRFCPLATSAKDAAASAA